MNAAAARAVTNREGCLEDVMRIGNLVAVAGLAAFVAGCGSDSSCKDESPPLAVDPVTVCPAVKPNQQVTATVKACPRCDQGTPTCLVHVDSATQITLEPNSQVCDANASCPIVDPASCQAAPLTCTFTAPALADGQTFFVNVISPSGTIQEQITVQSNATCGG